MDAVISNIFGPGFGLALFNLVLAAAPQENRMAYLGVQNVVPALLTAVGSLLGGWLTNALHDFAWVVYGQTLLNFHLIFALSVAGRLALIPLAHRLHEDKAHPVGVLLGLVRDRIQYTLVEGFAKGIAVLKRWRH